MKLGIAFFLFLFLSHSGAVARQEQKQETSPIPQTAPPPGPAQFPPYNPPEVTEFTPWTISPRDKYVYVRTQCTTVNKNRKCWEQTQPKEIPKPNEICASSQESALDHLSQMINKNGASSLSNSPFKRVLNYHSSCTRFYSGFVSLIGRLKLFGRLAARNVDPRFPDGTSTELLDSNDLRRWTTMAPQFLANTSIRKSLMWSSHGELRDDPFSKDPADAILFADPLDVDKLCLPEVPAYILLISNLVRIHGFSDSILSEPGLITITKNPVKGSDGRLYMDDSYIFLEKLPSIIRELMPLSTRQELDTAKTLIKKMEKDCLAFEIIPNPAVFGVTNGKKGRTEGQQSGGR